MNIEQLRQSLRHQWLNYYQEHRPWLMKLGVWVNHEGQRRPSASFILATATCLEPALTDLLPLVVDLSQDPDQIVEALGLNFDPEIALRGAIAPREEEPVPKLLPSRADPIATSTQATSTQTTSTQTTSTQERKPKRLEPRVAEPAPEPSVPSVPAIARPGPRFVPQRDDDCQGKYQRPDADRDR